MISETRCYEAGKDIPSLITGLPQQITDNDLDRNGEYYFEKVMGLKYPKDFKGIDSASEHKSTDGKEKDILAKRISIDLGSNFDISASVEFEYDLSLYTLALTELTKDDGEFESEESHQ